MNYVKYILYEYAFRPPLNLFSWLDSSNYPAPGVKFQLKKKETSAVFLSGWARGINTGNEQGKEIFSN